MANTTKTPEVLADETYEQRQDREDAARHEAEEALAQDPSVVAAAIADHNAEMAEQEGIDE
jgi:hypothetical protein